MHLSMYQNFHINLVCEMDTGRNSSPKQSFVDVRETAIK